MPFLVWTVATRDKRKEEGEREGELRNARREGGSCSKVLGRVSLETCELSIE